ncbi:MAG: hypothetical protein ACFFD1_03020 [Candidatus Thorarchaeota archaeon]
MRFRNYKIKNSMQNKIKMKWIMIFSFLSLLVTSTIVILILDLSGYAGTMDDTQLGFNGDTIKAYFALMNSFQLNLFLLANIIDYLFMISYGLFFFSSAKLLSWEYRRIPHVIGTAFAGMGILAALCDATENIFIITMTLNPTSFPSWLAIFHSSFATLKFLFMFLTIVWLLFSFLINKIPPISRMVVKPIPQTV